MTKELKDFCSNREIATSRTTPYNPCGNGQVERYNGIIWRGVTLALKSKELPVTQWETVLPDVLHSVRSLLSTATNATPHERLFNYSRKSSSGRSMPSWLMSPGPVFLKRHVRNSKYEPLVDEVQLIEANPDYAHVRFPNGRQTTVSIRHLAPVGDVLPTEDHPAVVDHSVPTTLQDDAVLAEPFTEEIPQAMTEEPVEGVPMGGLRRSGRQREPPKNLNDYVLSVLITKKV
jgi:hypothetical protein